MMNEKEREMYRALLDVLDIINDIEDLYPHLLDKECEKIKKIIDLALVKVEGE